MLNQSALVGIPSRKPGKHAFSMLIYDSDRRVCPERLMRYKLSGVFCQSMTMIFIIRFKEADMLDWDNADYRCATKNSASFDVLSKWSRHKIWLGFSACFTFKKFFKPGTNERCDWIGINAEMQMVSKDHFKWLLGYHNASVTRKLWVKYLIRFWL